MGGNSIFFSLKWKLAILFGCVFLVLQTVFAYLSYRNAQVNFENDRKTIQASHFKIAETLTRDSFIALEQFAELVSSVDDPLLGASGTRSDPVSALDENWPRWQLIWGIENSALFDKEAVLIKSWGQRLAISDDKVQHVLKNEQPEHQVFCPDNCYQRAIVPVMGKTDINGVFSVIRSFSDVIIKYNNATNSDIGVLIADQDMGINANDAAPTRWKLQLSGMTRPEKNLPVFNYVSQHYTIDEFYRKSKRISYENTVYEVSVITIQNANGSDKPPFFLFIDEITQDVNQLNDDLKNIWLYSISGLLASLILIVLALQISFRQITRLSDALPLLSKNDFEQFRRQVSVISRSSLGSDELDKLSLTALSLADQLEHLEYQMRSQTISLMEKSHDLAKERDYLKQLIDLAPVVIINQKLNGIILAINHLGVDCLETDSHTIKGKVFDVFIPESDQEHLKNLARLRSGQHGDQLQLDGLLVTETGKLREFSWLHKLLPSKDQNEAPVLLTIGVDISERKIAEARNIRMAYYDYLTGLGNRRKFQEEFAQKLATANRYGHQLALFYLDLDRFKEINDTNGHEAGDSFLKTVANTLKEAVRSTDLLCRLGGDEFTLLMPHAETSGVEHIANKINTVLNAIVLSDRNYVVSASIGVAIFPIHGTTVNELMANADLAMYKAKELGRGQYHLYDPTNDYRGKLKQTVHWRNLLEDAVTNDKFVLFYQPILTIKSNDVSHYECLVRLKQDDGTMLMPSEFVFRAEELGLIGKIDRLVLKKAVAQHLEFKRQGKLHKLSVNVSKRTFEEPVTFQYFAELFNNPEVDQKRIIFEITDSAAISNYQSTNVLINKISALGCVMALNDFGVEYPSLHYLKNAPVDYVKIDGSLVRQIDKNNEDKIFVKTLIELAQAFGKKTVAEFVESEDILTILKEFGIDYVQGYHIGKPEAME